MAGEKKTLIVCCIAVFLWLMIGTLVYKLADNCSTDTSCDASGQLVDKEVCGWTVAESFYYSVQAGLSIGFGLLPENQEGSRFYSILHILAGSSFVGGVLAFFVTLLITRHKDYHDKTEKAMNRLSQRLHVDGYKGFKLEELRPLMVRHPRFYRDILEMVEKDDVLVGIKMDTYKQLTKPDKVKAVDELITEAHSQVDSLKGGRLTIDDMKALSDQERGFRYRFKMYCVNNWSFCVVWSLFSFWILLGVIYGIVAEKWSFIQSVYFAVSTCSTAGLQGVTRDDWCVLFAGFYSLVGVPLYAAALGTFANVIVDKYNASIFEEKMNAKFEVADVQFVEHVNGKGAAGELDLTDFIEIQLLKLGSVDRDLLGSLRDQFNDLDKEGTGKIKTDLLVEKDKRRIKRVNAKKEGGQP